VVIVDHSCSAYMCPCAREFSYLLSIFIPHQECKSLFWKGGIQIEEGRLALARHRGMLVAYGPADLGAFAIMCPGLSSSEGLRISDARPSDQRNCDRYRPHGFSERTVPGCHTLTRNAGEFQTFPPGYGEISNMSQLCRICGQDGLINRSTALSSAFVHQPHCPQIPGHYPISHESATSRSKRTRISCHATMDRAACAAFLKVIHRRSRPAGDETVSLGFSGSVDPWKSTDLSDNPKVWLCIRAQL
jgi:hypothetical protein